MTEQKKHNGWSNYATWRIKLEMFEGWVDYHTDDAGFESFESPYELSKYLKDYAEEQIENYLEQNTKGINLARDYALAFMEDVNWVEIAESLMEDYPQLLTSNN